MKKIIILVICAISINFSFAQYDVNTAGDMSVLGATSGLWITNKSTNTVQGSPYLFENWHTFGVITTEDDKNYSLQDINLDTRTNAFVAKISNDSLYMFNIGNIKDIRINNKHFSYVSNDGRKTFYEVVAISQKFKILKENKKDVIEGQLNPMTQVAAPDKLIDSSKYFILRNDEIVEFKMRKGRFLKLFGSKSDKIKDFMKDEELSYKNDRHLQIILNYWEMWMVLKEYMI